METTLNWNVRMESLPKSNVSQTLKFRWDPSTMSLLGMQLWMVRCKLQVVTGACRHPVFQQSWCTMIQCKSTFTDKLYIYMHLTWIWKFTTNVSGGSAQSQICRSPSRLFRLKQGGLCTPGDLMQSIALGESDVVCDCWLE